jgi:hypothetical protein
MLKPWDGKTASEEKGVLLQRGMELPPEFSGGCRPAWALVRCYGLCPWGSTLPGRRIKRLEIGELFRVGCRSVSQERRRLKDRLSDDRNAQNLFKGLLGKCNN